VPLRRSAWFFDVHEQGEGLTDVGTHLVDLVTWVLFPEQGVDYRQDIEIHGAERRPTTLTRGQFQHVTGEADFPEYLRPNIQLGRLDYYCNTLVSYSVRGVHAKLNILWNLQASAGEGDTHYAVFRGTRSRVEVRQGEEQNYRPEVYVVPNNPDEKYAVLAALRAKVAALQAAYPGVAVKDMDSQFWVTVPNSYRTGHESHFSQVTQQFLRYLEEPKSLPAWEKANMLAKYYVTTQGVERSRQVPG
jgi:predicted dehydrogenase